MDEKTGQLHSDTIALYYTSIFCKISVQKTSHFLLVTQG